VSAPSRTGDRFLHLFDPDPVKAAARLEQIRARLVTYFVHRDRDDAENLASEVIARGYARLSSGTTLEHEDPIRFFYGIARNVNLEARREETRRAHEDNIEGHVDRLIAPPDAEQVVRLREALTSLSPTEREILVEYCTGNRVDLARRLGTSPTALRVRVHHIRRKLVP
jgi:DNA-directed RNA polymerase specialized sigma24 family protein